MRHQKHKYQLGRKKEHRIALMASLAAALIKHGRIKTTLTKAKALRPFAERLVTLAKKGGLANRRLAAARIRDPKAVQILFDDRVSEFTDRNGGYTRIYKLEPRTGDAAEMALIEWVPANDPGYRGSKRKAKGKSAKSSAISAPTKESSTGSDLSEPAKEAPEQSEGAASANGEESSAPPEKTDLSGKPVEKESTEPSEGEEGKK